MTVLLFLFLFLFAPSAHALVWDGTMNPSWLTSEGHTENWHLNNAEIEWRAGTSNDSLHQLQTQFAVWAARQKVRTFGGEAMGRMMHCYYSLPSCGCLFARRAVATHFQWAQLRGMPKVTGPAQITFADQTIVIAADETYLHLKPQSPHASSLLFVHHAQELPWDTLQKNWKALGWRASSREANDLFYEKQGSFLYLHRRNDNLWMIHQPGERS